MEMDVIHLNDEGAALIASMIREAIYRPPLWLPYLSEDCRLGGRDKKG